METKNPMLVRDSIDEIPSHRIHNFITKVLQPHVFENLLAYVNWRIELNKGNDVPPPTFGPVSINLDITTACNHYCHHCIDLELLNNGRRLSLKCVETLIEKLVAQGLKSVIVIGGGEPTVHPQFVEIIRCLKSRDLEVGVVSNGIRTDRLAESASLLKAPRDWMRLSLDAATDESFDLIHNSKSKKKLSEILADVREMRKKWSDFQMGYSYLALCEDFHGNNRPLLNNLREIPEAARLAREHGFTYLSVKPFISPEPSRITDPDSEYVAETKRQVALAKQYETKNFEVLESFNLFALFTNQNERLRIQPTTCHSNFFRVVVTPDGVFSCPVWRGFEMVQLTKHDQDFSADYNEYFNKNRLRILNDLDASKACAQVTCIYNDLNWFIEDLIEHPEKIKDLKMGADYHDYFL